MFEWQATIALSILGSAFLAHFFGGMVLNKNQIEFFKSNILNFPTSVAFVLSFGWAIWTLEVINSNSLMLIQFLTIGGSFLAVYYFFRNKDPETNQHQINQVKEEANQTSKEVNQAKREIKISQENIARLEALYEDLKTKKSFGEIQIEAEEIETLTGIKEHKIALKDVLKTSKKRVIIKSGWVNEGVVNAHFENLLRSALKRGVTFYIEYGYKKKGEEHPTFKPFKEIQDWCSQHKTKGKLMVRKHPTHEKLLIKDSDYLVNGSFNWLSNIGFSDNAEMSLAITDKETIESIASRIIADFTK